MHDERIADNAVSAAPFTRLVPSPRPSEPVSSSAATAFGIRRRFQTESDSNLQNNTRSNTDTAQPFFGAMGCTAAIVFTCLGASYGTAKSGVGIAAMGVLRPDLIVKSASIPGKVTG
jgi:hypothetical protein